MSNIKTQDIVRTLTVRGRTIDIELTTWKDSDGLSYDIYDQDTGECLTPESYDDEPDAVRVEELLSQLRDDLTGGTLAPFFEGAPLPEILFTPAELAAEVARYRRALEHLAERAGAMGFIHPPRLAEACLAVLAGEDITKPQPDVEATP